MWEGSYSSEPFDLRLTVLRLVRNIGWIVLFTLIGTLIFGGGYYVKNVLCGEPARYEMTITCKMEYTTPPMQSGDYYINEMTWNTYVQSQEFWGMIAQTEPFAAMDVDLDSWLETSEGVDEVLSAAVASDIQVPSFTVSMLKESKTETLCQAVQEVLTGSFAESLPEVASIRVLDVSEVQRVREDVRPFRAVMLSALLSFFFVTVFLLIREIGADSIWLPATLRRRYGLKALGTIQSPEINENIDYLFSGGREIADSSGNVRGDDGLHKVAVCPVERQTDIRAVTDALKKIRPEMEWIPVPAPILSPETAQVLRQAKGVLLVVEAGLHAGKPLEYVLEFFDTQDVPVTAALLWNADETLIRSYYVTGRIGTHREDGDVV